MYSIVNFKLAAGPLPSTVPALGNVDVLQSPSSAGRVQLHVGRQPTVQPPTVTLQHTTPSIPPSPLPDAKPPVITSTPAKINTTVNEPRRPSSPSLATLLRTSDILPSTPPQRPPAASPQEEIHNRYYLDREGIPGGTSKTWADVKRWFGRRQHEAGSLLDNVVNKQMLTTSDKYPLDVQTTDDLTKELISQDRLAQMRVNPNFGKPMEYVANTPRGPVKALFDPKKISPAGLPAGIDATEAARRGYIQDNEALTPTASPFEYLTPGPVGLRLAKTVADRTGASWYAREMAGVPHTAGAVGPSLPRAVYNAATTPVYAPFTRTNYPTATKWTGRASLGTAIASFVGGAAQGPSAIRKSTLNAVDDNLKNYSSISPDTRKEVIGNFNKEYYPLLGDIITSDSPTAKAHRAVAADLAVPYIRQQLNNVTKHPPASALVGNTAGNVIGKVTDAMRSSTPFGALMTAGMYATRKPMDVGQFETAFKKHVLNDADRLIAAHNNDDIINRYSNIVKPMRYEDAYNSLRRFNTDLPAIPRKVNAEDRPVWENNINLGATLGALTEARSGGIKPLPGTVIKLTGNGTPDTWKLNVNADLSGIKQIQDNRVKPFLPLVLKPSYGVGGATAKHTLNGNEKPELQLVAPARLK